MEFTFRVREKLKEAWPIYKKHFWKFMFLLFVPLALAFIVKDNIILNLIVFVINLYFSCVLLIYLLKITKGEDFDLFKKENIPSVKTVWHFFSTYFIYSIIVMIGFVLLIVPGFYLSGRLLPSVFYAIDKNKNAISSIGDVWDMTKNHGWYLFWVYFKIGLFSILGLLILIIGAFVITMPLAYILTVMLYQDFMKFKSSSFSSIVSEPISETTQIENK